MGLIAIAANPASGRDIRRLVSHATVFNNSEKQNIVERIILAASQLGEHRFCIMPDSYRFAQRLTARLAEDLQCIPAQAIFTPPLAYTDSQADTTAFAAWAEAQGADVLVVLGGDGTSRAAAKGLGDLPMIPISTGTNNVFPEVAEGTVVGMAAAALACGIVTPQDCCRTSKRIEIAVNGQYRDLALVDAVFSGVEYTGAKAIWNPEDISRVVVTQCHPASIGFSALAGCRTIVSPEEDWGAAAECGTGPANTRVSLAAGVVTPVAVSQVRRVPLGQTLTYTMERTGILALDGERELLVRAGDTLALTVTRNGPRRVDLRRALALAQERGFFQYPGTGEAR